MLASYLIGDDNGGGDDVFRADEAWRLATFLTIGYLISRGLAKSGSREPYWEDRGDRDGDGGVRGALIGNRQPVGASQSGDGKD